MLALIFRPNNPHSTCHAYRRAFEHLGVPFTHIDNNALIANPHLLDGFDSAVVLDDGFALKPVTLPNLPDNSVYVGIDMHVGFEDGYLPFLAPYKHIFAAQYTHGVKVLESWGFRNVSWLPCAWDSIGIPCVPMEPPDDLWYPVCFIASATTEQRALLRDVVRYKYDGATQESFDETYAERLSSSKIALNVLGGVGHKTFYNHVNQRTFESLAGGGLLVQQDLWNPFTSERIPDMELLGLKGVQGWFRNVRQSNGEHFWDRKEPDGDEHYVYWKDHSSLTATLDYYLNDANEDERVAIAERGRQWVTENHTYIHRARTILNALGIEHQ